MWSTGNFIKGDFPPALVIALRINIFLASRMDGLQGSFFLFIFFGGWGGRKCPELTPQPTSSLYYPFPLVKAAISRLLRILRANT